MSYQGDDRVQKDLLTWIRELTLSADNLTLYKLTPKERRLFPRRLNNLRNELIKLRGAFINLGPEETIL